MKKHNSKQESRALLFLVIAAVLLSLGSFFMRYVYHVVIEEEAQGAFVAIGLTIFQVAFFAMTVAIYRSIYVNKLKNSAEIRYRSVLKEYLTKLKEYDTIVAKATNLINVHNHKRKSRIENCKLDIACYLRELDNQTSKPLPVKQVSDNCFIPTPFYIDEFGKSVDLKSRIWRPTE